MNSGRGNWLGDGFLWRESRIQLVAQSTYQYDNIHSSDAEFPSSRAQNIAAP